METESISPKGPAVPEPPKPSISLDGDAAAPFADYDIGHVCRLSGDFKLVSKSDHAEFGPTVRLEAVGDVSPEGSEKEEASETPEEESAEDTMSDEDEEKALGYKRPKSTKESPDISAKNLM